MSSTPAARIRAISARHISRVCSRPTAFASASTNDCTPKLTRFIPCRNISPSVSSLNCPGAHSSVNSAPAATSNSPRSAANNRRICSALNKLGVPPPKKIVSTRPGSATCIRFAAALAPAISAHTRSTYRPIRSAPNTPEAKLQYVHFALQNGTEMYTPTELLNLPLLFVIPEGDLLLDL
jgi:hypothetical protein